MKKFNSERELYKLRYGTRDKIVLSIFLLLVVISIGSTYALYQVRHSKRIIYTTVADFSKDIKLAVYFDGGKQKSFPSKDQGYIYSEIKCDNGGTATFDYVNWKLRLETNGPDKCDVYFTKGIPNLTSNCKNMPLNKCLKENNDNFANLIDDDPDHNIRYIGKEVNNYIWFNCDSYDNLTQDSAKTKCEKWRIIGLMKDMQKSDSTTEDLVKIIRSDSIGEMQWDDPDETFKEGHADWTQSSLQISLNTTYYNGQSLGTGKGITTQTKEKMIEKVIWNIGGIPSEWGTKVVKYYHSERGNNTIDWPVTWPGHIAIMYASDYGYATNGSIDGRDRKTCLEVPLTNLAQDISCFTNTWLDISTTADQWELAPLLVYNLSSVDHVSQYGSNGTNASTKYAIRPSLYLTSSVKIISGDGSASAPYIINS